MQLCAPALMHASALVMASWLLTSLLAPTVRLSLL
jgi:hypothetical protein